MKRIIASFALGLLGAALYPLAGAIHWEERFGLAQLFQWRGDRPAPDQVALVAINEDTAQALSLPASMTDWPREMHARLVDRLTELNASAIAFDVYFRPSDDPAQDQIFADSLRRSDRVILFAHSRRQVVELGTKERLYIDKLVEPAPVLVASAKGIAPFVLPKWPAQVSRFWTHQEGTGDRPTLPLAMLSLWQEKTGHALGSGGLQPNERVFNFYGPPHSVPTLTFQQVLQEANLPIDLRGRAVFVGFIARHQPDQRDTFNTVFSSADGVDLTGVELAATAFANLLEGSDLKASVSLWTLITFTFGFVVMLCARLPRPSLAVAAPLFLAAIYTGLVYQLFVRFHLWLPLVVPVMILTPVALIWSSLVRNRMLRVQRDRIRLAFGRYLPEAEVKRLVRQPTLQLNPERMSGVCLATDAENYTTLAERLAPEELAELMSRYYEAVFGPIRKCGGIISDVAGDGVIALWPAGELDDDLFECVCEAAQEIQEAIYRFNQDHPETQLPTRIGIHAGAIVLGHLGALDHFEYRAVGDIVNTTCRLQALNKPLGTSILVSAGCLARVQKEQARYLGCFLLSGKRQPIDVCELPTGPPVAETLKQAFSQALELLKGGQIAGALKQFEDAARRWPADGPTRFYRVQCEQSLQGVSDLLQNGCVRVSSK